MAGARSATKNAEGEKAEDGAVGVACELVDGVDGAGAVQGIEDDDGHGHEDGHREVDALADLDLVGLAQDVHREGSREGSESRSTRAVGADHETDDKEDAHDGGQEAAGSDGRKEAVAGFGNAVRGRELVQERAQAQEAGDDDRLQEAAHDEVLLRVAVVLAGQCPLHHVLVQAGHRDDREQAPQELFPEVLRVVHVVEEEYPLMDPDAAEVAADEEDRQGDRHNHAGGSGDIHADDGFYAMPEGKGQTDRHVTEHIQPEGEAQRPEHEQLQGQAHEEQPDRGPQHLGEEEEPGARLVGSQAEPVFQVLVDRDDVQFEIEGREHEGDDQVAQEKADAHLQVAKPARAHHARDGDECHAGHAGADHREGDNGPVRLAPAVVEG